MTTQALSQAITLRHELPIDDLLRMFPDFGGTMNRSAAGQLTQSDQTFWTTFAFGSIQAAVLFGLIYAYFAL